jgi:hypothetical protein
VVRDRVYKRGCSYLLGLHWATNPGHRLGRWTRLARTHSPCRLCRSSSSSLLLSGWPVTQEYFMCLRDGILTKTSISDEDLSSCYDFILIKVTLKSILHYIKNVNSDVPICPWVHMWLSTHSILSFNNNGFHRMNYFIFAEFLNNERNLMLSLFILIFIECSKKVKIILFFLWKGK